MTGEQENRGWKVTAFPGHRVSVITPIGDSRKHNLGSFLCECGVEIEEVMDGETYCGIIISHRSFDGREALDMAYAIINPPDD
jgi:hypothetical protein